MSSSTNEDERLLLSVYELAQGSVLQMALKVAIELDVLEIVAKGGPGAHLSASEIVSQLSTSNPKAIATLDRIMRLLASYSILTCKLSTRGDGRVERFYGLAPVCKFLIRNQDGASFTPLLLLTHDKAITNSWYHMKDAILEGGEPFNRANGMSPYEYTIANPAFGNLYNKAMGDISMVSPKKLVEVYKGFEGIQRLVDVGGRDGSFLNLIISKYPHIKGINFDLPKVVANAPHYSGIEHVGGDMFVSVPSGDAILMKWVLVDWDDDHCVKFMKNCYKALPQDGKLIVMENIVPELIENNVATRGMLLVDVIETVWMHKGGQRTEKEFKALAKQAGFASINVACGACGYWAIECYK